jgi:hypothetical protein
MIQRLASESGKPLEVVVAQAFLSDGESEWTARLGSYFDDGGKSRELDVVAERSEVLENLNTTCRMRATVSCRGFPVDEAIPLTFSLSPHSPLLLSPNFLVGHRVPRSSHAHGSPDHETGALLGAAMAAETLVAAGLDHVRPLVAYEVLEYKPARNKQPEEYSLKGDRRIYEAVDSAVKAAIWWQQEDFQVGPEGFVSLNIPICVFSLPFWDMCIDDGKVGEPEQRAFAYQTNAYPTNAHRIAHANITTIVTARRELTRLVKALDLTFVKFRNAFEASASAWLRRP